MASPESSRPAWRPSAGGGDVPLHLLWPTTLIVASVMLPSYLLRLAALTVIYLVLFTRFGETFGMYTFPPMLLLMLVVNRWLKTISLVLALVGFAIFFATASWVLTHEPLGYPANHIIFLAVLAMNLYVVHLIVRAYERKLFSDASYAHAFLWMLFVPWWVHLDRGWWRTVTAIAVYAAVTAITLPLLRRAARRHMPASLLVLRTFGSPRRTRRLFEQVGARWRYIGPIHLIGDAASATANLDLSEAMRYLTFRFRSLFVTGEADLERRLAALDCAPDPDGRYRVNDFFCFDDTWKPTVQRLLARSHAVLVDLSGYRPTNRGVQYELALLAAAERLDSCVIVTDGSISAADVEQLAGEPVRCVLIRPRPRNLVAALCDAAAAAGGRVQSPA